ncbi:hypothetical protein ACJIZ3_021102 [Penstemon smallii]|uniref:Uncharacterized protein n=1 Tax=Penstemon smallii TaxID=265156 RepID=A0ABD3SLF4_9LAMI
MFVAEVSHTKHRLTNIQENHHPSSNVGNLRGLQMETLQIFHVISSLPSSASPMAISSSPLLSSKLISASETCSASDTCSTSEGKSISSSLASPIKSSSSSSAILSKSSTYGKQYPQGAHQLQPEKFIIIRGHLNKEQRQQRSISEAPRHAFCLGFFSMSLSRNALSDRSLMGLPLYTILTPERRVWAIAATDGCTCEARTINSHQPTRSALLLLMKINKYNNTRCTNNQILIYWQGIRFCPSRSEVALDSSNLSGPLSPNKLSPSVELSSSEPEVVEPPSLGEESLSLSDPLLISATCSIMFFLFGARMVGVSLSSKISSKCSTSSSAAASASF